MCFFIPVRDMPKGSASSLIEALPAPESFEYGAAGRVGEGGERAVDGWWILNHSVHYSGSSQSSATRSTTLPRLRRSATRAKASRAPLQRKDRVDRRPQRACVGEARELEQLVTTRLHHEVRRTVHLLRDGDHSGCIAKGACERLAADRIEDEVARFARSGQLLPGELDGEMADSATRTQNAYLLALAQITVIKKALPRAEPSEGERRALDLCESAWLRREHGRRNNRILRRDAVAVDGCECEDLVTRSDVAYTRSNFRNDARQLVGRDRRQMLCGPG
jgi:hypothetical protein